MTEDLLEGRLRDALRHDEQAARAAARRLAARAADEGAAEVAYTLLDSPVGSLLAARTGRGLVRLAYVDEREQALLADLSERVSPRIVEAPARLDELRRELDEYFAGRRRAFELELDWALVSPFTRRVLGATARIPFGAVSSYREVAERAGSPRAQRAAGNALNANPLPIVVPCHRVLRSGGALGGYGGGTERKRFLLGLEGALGDG